MRNAILFFFFLVLLITLTPQVHAQQFGRNKPHYETFDFKVKRSPNFELYHYLNNDSLARALAAASERWYQSHRIIFRDTFPQRNPIIFYANHADFWQTNAILGSVGIGTGGVTEALKNRMVMPLMELNSQTHHVLGHELVHAFQYKMLQNKEDSIRLTDIQNIPLWMIEGLAEYLSTGSVDPHTAMWMRDAVRENDFPSLKDMTRDSRYFPYRYGQAFWAYITGVLGDTVIYSLFRKTALLGYERAILEATGLDQKAFSEAWKKNLSDYYKKFHPLTADSLSGKLLLGEKVGNINIAPSISPNGQYVAFLSEKNFFTIDLFLANAYTGEIIKTLASTAREGHIDDISYIESAGTWSPHSDRFAFVSFAKGNSILSIVEMKRKGKVRSESIPGIPYFSNPSWSPDGEYIVVSGMVEGHTDLYLYHLKTKKVTQLTNDWYSDVQPQWSPDGKYIVFASDRPAPKKNYSVKSLQLCLYDIEKSTITVLDIFPGAENLNPLFSPDMNSIYFLSNRDGFRNLYRYDMTSGDIYQLTEYLTGISGITSYSPAVSISARTGKISYSYYAKRKYSVYVAKPGDFREKKVDPTAVDFSAGILPPNPRLSPAADYDNIQHTADEPKENEDSPYKARLSLEYIGNEVGVGASSSAFGTGFGMAGSVNLLFGDMMGYHRIFTALALNGEVYDFGGQAAYLNQKKRIHWGASISHIPYRSSAMGFVPDTVYAGGDTLLTDNLVLDVYRNFEKSAEFFLYFPFSTTKRVELGTGYSFYSFRLDRYNNHYYNGYVIDRKRERLPAPKGFQLGNVYAAFVSDNSYFGIASPLRGRRYRIEIEKGYDALDYHTISIDYRHYAFLNPTTLAFRLLHIGRHGKDAEDGLLYPLSFAYPTLTRGNSLVNIDRYATDKETPYSINQVYGSSILVVNAEWRIPFTGPERLSRIKSDLLFTELAFFADGGLAWDSSEGPSLEVRPRSPHHRVPFISGGISLRVNLFGMMVLEPYYAWPWRGDKFDPGLFGINFTPGW